MRADVHEGPEHMLQSEAGYIDARPHRQDRRKPLAPHCRTIQTGQSETPNHVRDEGSFPLKRSLGAGDGCTASHSQPRLLLMAELAPISDAGAGDPGICNGPEADIDGFR